MLIEHVEGNNTIEPSFTGDPFDGMLESPNVSEKSFQSDDMIGP